MLPALLKRFGLGKAGGVAPVEQVLPLGIRDVKRFAELDRLINAGFQDVPQDKIPDEVIIAVEEGLPIPFTGPSRDNVFAATVSERKPKQPPRQMTPEKIERRRYLAKQRYDYRFPGRRKGD